MFGFNFPCFVFGIITISTSRVDNGCHKKIATVALFGCINLSDQLLLKQPTCWTQICAQTFSFTVPMPRTWGSREYRGRRRKTTGLNGDTTEETDHEEDIKTNRPRGRGKEEDTKTKRPIRRGQHEETNRKRPRRRIQNEEAKTKITRRRGQDERTSRRGWGEETKTKRARQRREDAKTKMRRPRDED